MYGYIFLGRLDTVLCNHKELDEQANAIVRFIKGEM